MHGKFHTCEHNIYFHKGQSQQEGTGNKILSHALDACIFYHETFANQLFSSFHKHNNGTHKYRTVD